MKRIGSLLLVAVLGGSITLGAYKFLFENNNYAIISADENGSLVNTSFTPTSAKGAGINEVDFTIAAENTVNAVVHVKNVTIGKSTNTIFDFFYGSGSGGALVNTNGDLIGINTAISSRTGPYAIEKGLNEIEGVYISGIVEDSGAEEADLQEGDVVKMIDKIKIKKYPDLTGYLSTKRPGDTVEMLIDRDNEQLTVEVTLKERQTIIVPEMGMEVKNLSDKDKKRFKTKIGVKITGVPERYRGYGLDGKVIISVDDTDIENITDAKNAFGAISRYGKTVITMLNEDGERERLIFQ